MARIILGSYMVRYPLGGMMSWVLQYLVGFQQLGHEVYFVEKADYPHACFDPTQGIMTDDCYYGTATVKALLDRFKLQDQWCFVDFSGNYYGRSREQITEVFQSADLFIDMGTHGSWLDEAAVCGCRVLVELEPGYTQIKMEQKIASGEILPNYDAYYTNGSNIGTDKSEAPTAGKDWHHIINPIVASLFSVTSAPVDAPLTTVMNWQAHELIQFQGKTYGQKDREFPKFLDLPKYAVIPLELAVSGKNLPSDNLVSHGWRLRSAHQVTESVDSFWNYIRSSWGEFSICKNVFVATNSGWFSDRSAAYLASGRPVVMQDTGFSNHLPCGEGLFAVRTVAEAAAAINAIAGNYEQHSQTARNIALEYLEAKKVLGKFLDELGIS